jgi:hypothetical protein
VEGREAFRCCGSVDGDIDGYPALRAEKAAIFPAPLNCHTILLAKRRGFGTLARRRF